MAIVKGRNISIGNRTVSIQSSTITGSYDSDSISPDFYNAPGNRTGDTFYPSDDGLSVWTALTKISSRDQEVSTNFNKGYIFIRATANRALYCYYQSDYAGVGLLEIGVVINFDTTPQYYSYYRNEGINSTFAYSSAHTFIFGSNGFDIYFKLNGTTIYSEKEYGHVESGQAGIKATFANGFSLKMLPTKSLYSIPFLDIIDPRDFGLKEGHTTGSMSSGGYALTVANASLYNPNEKVIIGLGGEPSINGRAAGTRGTRGGGGTFPNTSYPNVAALQADRSKANNFNAWVEDTGLTYYNSVADNIWYPRQYFGVAGQGTHEYDYYFNTAVPVAYVGKILSIAGNVLTMDTPATTSINDGDVYFDNLWILSKLTADLVYDRFFSYYPVTSDYRYLSLVYNKNYTIKIPSGNYAISEKWLARNRPNFIITGAGKNSTKIFSPKGCQSASLNVTGCDNVVIRDFELEGNGITEGYGLVQRNWTEPSNIPSRDYFTNAVDYFPAGLEIYGCNNPYVTGMKFKNNLANSIHFYACNNAKADYFDLIHDTGHKMYISWMMIADACQNVWFDHFTFYSGTITGACEIFTGKDSKFTNGTVVNGRISSNSSEKLEVSNVTVNIQAMSRPSWMHPNDPIISFNANANNFNNINDPLAGGLIEDVEIVVEGFIDAYNNGKQGITINQENSNVVVRRVTYSAPNYTSPATASGAVAIVSTGQNVTVDGLIVTGLAGNNSPLYGSNIGVLYGIVKNCNANTIAVGTNVVLGTGAEANTGTVTIV